MSRFTACKLLSISLTLLAVEGHSIVFDRIPCEFDAVNPKTGLTVKTRHDTAGLRRHIKSNKIDFQWWAAHFTADFFPVYQKPVLGGKHTQGIKLLFTYRFAVKENDDGTLKAVMRSCGIVRRFGHKEGQAFNNCDHLALLPTHEGAPNPFDPVEGAKAGWRLVHVSPSGFPLFEKEQAPSATVDFEDGLKITMTCKHKGTVAQH